MTENRNIHMGEGNYNEYEQKGNFGIGHMSGGEIKGDAKVEKAFNAIMRNAKRYDAKADIRGVLVTPMLKDGMEIIIGTKIDDQFGRTPRRLRAAPRRLLSFMARCAALYFR